MRCYSILLKTAVQLEASERLPEGIDLDTLRKYFTLTTEDLEEVEQCRGAINKLGFAVQLCTLRWQGYFLRDTRGVPEIALEIVASQLGLLAIPIDDYPQNEKTRWEHLERIREHLGFSRCDVAWSISGPAPSSTHSPIAHSSPRRCS